MGSNPTGSTTSYRLAGLGYQSLELKTRVRIPVGGPKLPYITKDRRDFLDGRIESLVRGLETLEWVEGDVNYTFYKILLAWFKFESRYKTICSIMGTLTSVTQEFYRKVAGPYEDKAEEKNGKIT